MSRVAIFVDAGYLFAGGSTALTGAKKPRAHLSLEQKQVVAELKKIGSLRAADKSLLRIYWYDGASFKGPSLEQNSLAEMDDVKIRLGFLNSAGQQKGVDSLIVTDLIELARNNAVSDAVLLSGDEDVRVGVHVAQSFGVRVHLLGIVPSRGSQSKQLLQEADTTTEWDKTTVEKFLTYVAPAPSIEEIASVEESGIENEGKLAQVALDTANGLGGDTKSALIEKWKDDTGIPPEFDGKLLGRARDLLGTELSLDQRRYLRSRFRKLVGFEG